MYKHLQSISAFVAVAETGAFNKAAVKLGVKAPVVSHHISKLEEYLGTTLIYRTTRKISLSEHGRILFEKSHELMTNTNHALDFIMDARNEVIGSLRVTLPSFVPDPRVEEAILKFVEVHPNVSISLDYFDNISDLLDDKYDLSLRVGNLSDTALYSKVISTTKQILIASPELLAKYGTPATPSDLNDMPFVEMKSTGKSMKMHQGKKVEEVIFQNSRIVTNQIYGTLAAVKGNLGIANLPETICETDIKKGTLVQVLPTWKLPSFVLHALWPAANRRTTLTTRVVDFISAELRK